MCESLTIYNSMYICILESAIKIKGILRGSRSEKAPRDWIGVGGNAKSSTQSRRRAGSVYIARNLFTCELPGIASKRRSFSAAVWVVVMGMLMGRVIWRESYFFERF